MTKTIEFEDIRVGDKIRATRRETYNRDNGSVSVFDSTHEITVVSVDAQQRRVNDGGTVSIPTGYGDTAYRLELLERKVKEPKGIGAVVQFTNSVGVKRTYVRAGDCSWYNTINGLESWAALTSRAAGPIDVLSEGVEL